MQRWKQRLALLLTVLALCAATAFAHDVPDLTRTGTITVSMQYQGKPVPGGTLTLYRVGSVHEDDGNYSFALTDDFAASGESLAEPSSAALAGRLAQYAANAGCSGESHPIGSDGTAVIDDLTPGLYLVVQSKAATGYSSASPFLIGLPAMEDGAYVYEVDAGPKLALAGAPAPQPPKPQTPTSQTLPQTGQLNWPVPVLAALGLLLFAAGWALRFGRRNGYEK